MGVSKDKKKKLINKEEGSFSKPVFKTLPYTKNHAKIVRFTHPLCLNKRKKIQDYHVESLIEVFMRYVYYQEMRKKRKMKKEGEVCKKGVDNLSETFRKIFYYFENWLESFVEHSWKADEKKYKKKAKNVVYVYI